MLLTTEFRVQSKITVMKEINANVTSFNAPTKRQHVKPIVVFFCGACTTVIKLSFNIKLRANVFFKEIYESVQ